MQPEQIYQYLLFIKQKRQEAKEKIKEIRKAKKRKSH